MKITTSASFALASALLAGCAQLPAQIPPGRARLALHPLVMAEADPAVRAGCERSITAALQRHGFILDRAGTEVDIEVSFWQDNRLGELPMDDFSGNSSAGTTFSTGKAEVVAPRLAYTADLTVSIHEGSQPTKVLGSGQGEAIEAANSPMLQGGPARVSACSAAAERVADAMVEAMGKR